MRTIVRASIALKGLDESGSLLSHRKKIVEDDSRKVGFGAEVKLLSSPKYQGFRFPDDSRRKGRDTRGASVFDSDVLRQDQSWLPETICPVFCSGRWRRSQ